MAMQRGCEASARSSARSASSKPLAALGWRPIAAYTCGKASAAASARRQDALSVPTVSMRRTPAASAAETSSASGGAHRSRWVWESITAPLRRFGEQRLDLAHALDAPGAQLGAGERQVARAERCEQTLGGGGQVRPQQHAQRAQALDERAQHEVEPLRIALLAGQAPGSLLLHVAVEPPHALPDLLERRRQLRAADMRADALWQPGEVGGERRIARAGAYVAVAVAREHRDRAAR